MSDSFPPSPPTPFSQDSTLPYGGPQPRASGMAIASMVLGILAIPLMCAFGLGLPVGIVGLVLGIIALTSINKDPRQRSGKGFAITGIVLGCVSFLVVPVLLLLVFMPTASLGKARELSNRSMCAANLRGTAQSMNVYAADNADAYPIVSPSGGYALAGAGAGTPSADVNDTLKSMYFTARPSVTQNMWVLVLTGQVAPKQYQCKSDPGTLTSAVVTNSSGGYMTDFNNGSAPSNMSYSYSFAYPWTATPSGAPMMPGRGTSIGPWWRNQTDASLPVMADMAPLVGTGSPAATPTVPGKGANSFNHQRDGQNVAFGDAHAEFSRMPNVGQSSDNIYTSAGGRPDPTGMAFPGGMVPAIGTGGSMGAYDICLVPAADASKGYERK